MTVLSNRAIRLILRMTGRTQVLASWPTTNGRRSCRAIVPTESHVMVTDPSVVMRANTNRGVTNIFNRLEIDADTIAALTCPRAIATKVMDDWTVDGTSVRNRNPAARGAAIVSASISNLLKMFVTPNRL